MTANIDLERFRTGAPQYAAYLKTPEGRLRIDLCFENLKEFLSRRTRSLNALDLGCGTGTVAIRLAGLGVHVTLLDESISMLDLAERAAGEEGVTQRVTLKQGDAAQMSNLFRGELFDVILCHNILEYVDDPCGLLRSAAPLLRDSSSLLSVLVRNQAGEVLKTAIKDGDLDSAERNLNAESSNESLYGGSVRLFVPASLQAMLIAASLEVTSERGVRVLSDYLPAKISRDDQYERILDLESKLGRRSEWAAIARYTHLLAHPAGCVVRDGA